MMAAGFALGGCATVVASRGEEREALELTPCPIEGVDGQVLCGTLQVWEDRDARRGRRIPLNFVVLRALSSQPARDPLFTFAGGPGQSEAGDAEDNAERFAEIRRDRDIVMIDQRGTGRSNPLNCAFGRPAELVAAYLAGDLPIALVRECRAQLEQRADLRLYTTPIAMDDVDEVRRRLGYERINLYGGSYGSRAALVYLERHPNRVRTATLRAVFPLSLRNPLYSPRDAQQALDRLIADCAADSGCAGAHPNFQPDLAEVLARLAAHPQSLIVPAGGGGEARISITRDVFAGVLRRLLYQPRTQAMIPGLVAAAKAGDYTALRPILAQTFGIERAFSMGMFLSVTCAEDVAQIRDAEIGPATAGSFVGDVMVRSLVSACSGWPEGRLPVGYHRPVRSRAPVLLLSGALDPMTPPRYGAEVARTLPNARHLVMEGIAHGPFPDCAIGLMTALIRNGSTAALDTRCVAELRRPPFEGR